MTRLYKLRDQDLPPEAEKVAVWMRDYLATPNVEPLLKGRIRVCPALKGALNKIDPVYFAIEQDATTKEDVKSLIPGYLKLFAETDPLSGPDLRYKTIVVIFPNVEDPTEAIDNVQAELSRSVKVDHQMMIGEMHPDNMTAAVHQSDLFYPNRSPLPLLALRSMIYDDWERFLSPDVRPQSANPTPVEVWQRELDDREYLIAVATAMRRQARPGYALAPDHQAFVNQADEVVDEVEGVRAKLEAAQAAAAIVADAT